jgi:hypothetical protein
MEPHFVTDPTLMPVLNELMAREPIFHRAELGTTRQDFEDMMDPNFWEIGASGCRYSREYVLDTLEQRYANPTEDLWQTKDFYCMAIAPNHYLLTYTLIQGARTTRRATLWRSSALGWKIVYHQGTVVTSI